MFYRKRREFIFAVGGTVALAPFAARAQQAMPLMGFLNPFSPDSFAEPLRGFRRGLREAGYIEGENLLVEYRWAENEIGRLPTLAADLVRRRVAVIATTGGPTSALAARAATDAIPIVFVVSVDPIEVGLVTSLARPTGNLTGINFLLNEVAAKRLELLRELIPPVTRVAVLVNPAEAAQTQSTMRDVQSAAVSMGLQVQFVRASTPAEIDAAFAILARERPDALFVGPSPFLAGRRVQVTHLATRHAIPATYAIREFADAGGLMSYGASAADAWRQVGAYAGRILKGAKPTDLPIVQAGKIELVINHQAARTLGIKVPQSLLVSADEVIE